MPETGISNSDSEFARIQPTEFFLYSLPNHDLNRQEKFTVLIGKRFTMLEPHAGRDRETRLDMRDHGRRAWNSGQPADLGYFSMQKGRPKPMGAIL